jgi:hypothetical protein
MSKAGVKRGAREKFVSLNNRGFMDAETKQMFLSLAEILRETTQAALSGRNQSERTHRALLDSAIYGYKESYPSPDADDLMHANLRQLDDLISQLRQ